MKVKIWILFSLYLCCIASSAQNTTEELPIEVKERLLSIRRCITKQLDSCRFRNESLYLGLLSRHIDNDEGLINHEREFALSKLNLSWNMVFDNYMIDRTIQLLNNEYRKEELDSLVNRQWEIISKRSQWELVTMYELKINNSKIFKQTKDSLTHNRDKEMHSNWYSDEEVLHYLGIDTTAYFRLAVDSIIKSSKQEITDYYLNKFNFDIVGLIQSCGFIKDVRLNEPMLYLLSRCEKRVEFLHDKIETLKDKEETEIFMSYQDEKTENEKIMKALYISLVQMRVEPYYTHFFKIWGCPTNDYCIDYLDNDPIILFHNQDIFLIIANGLLSTDAVNITSEFNQGMAYESAFSDISRYIENESLLKIINNPKFNLSKDRIRIYDWMQKNYGKYKIRRIW